MRAKEKIAANEEERRQAAKLAAAKKKKAGNKKDPKEHGIGLLSVRDTINKFEGNFDCYERNNQFAVHIMIPN